MFIVAVVERRAYNMFDLFFFSIVVVIAFVIVATITMDAANGCWVLGAGYCVSRDTLVRPGHLFKPVSIYAHMYVHM